MTTTVAEKNLSTEATAEQKSALQATIETYFDALYNADHIMMGSIFHEHGVYATADESPALIRDKPTYMAVLANRESPAKQGHKRRDSIDSIDFAGVNTARAQVRCAIGNTDFVDYLSFVYQDGRWQIIAKIFHISN